MLVVFLSARSTGEDTNPAANSCHPGFVLLIQNKAVDCDRARRSRLRHIARHYVRKTRRRASARTGGLPTSRDRFRACWNSAVELYLAACPDILRTLAANESPKRAPDQ